MLLYLLQTHCTVIYYFPTCKKLAVCTGLFMPKPLATRQHPGILILAIEGFFACQHLENRNSLLPNKKVHPTCNQIVYMNYTHLKSLQQPSTFKMNSILHEGHWMTELSSCGYICHNNYHYSIKASSLDLQQSLEHIIENLWSCSLSSCFELWEYSYCISF